MWQDHLVLAVNLNCKPQSLNPPEQAHSKLNWRKAILDGSIQEFQEYVSSNLSPLLNHSLETIVEIDEEIISILHHAATETIPVIRNSTKVKNYIRDDGPVLTAWLKHILNSIISLEKIPASLKLRMIVPVFKGKCWDPLICCNYWDITLTSVLPKCLEILILERLESLFCKRGFPHPSQTSYQRVLSWIDTIFSTQEVIGCRVMLNASHHSYWEKFQGPVQEPSITMSPALTAFQSVWV